MDFPVSIVQYGFVGSGEVEKDNSAGNVSPLDRFRQASFSTEYGMSQCGYNAIQ